MENFSTEKDRQYFVLGNAAKGTIEAKGKQLDQLDEFTADVASGQYHQPVKIINLASCVDGRLPKVSLGELTANSAGGSISYFVADHLTSRSVTGNGSTLEGFTRMLDFLKDQRVTLGDHTGSYAEGEKTGCGANDSLENIYSYIATHGDILADWAKKLGAATLDETHNQITRRAREFSNFSPANELRDALKKRTTPDLVPKLEGDHKEVLTIINMREGTTLDREMLARDYGSNMQAFNVDAWAFEEAARQISNNEDEVEQKVAAMVYYNLATAFVLGGPGMRVVVIR